MRRALLLLPVAAGVSLGLIVTAHGAEAVANGGFESGGNGWTQVSTSGFCNASSMCAAPATPRTGSGWARIGGGFGVGMDNNRVGQISQQITIPPAPATLSLYLRITPNSGTGGYFAVNVDGTEVKHVNYNAAGYTNYAPVTVDLSAYTGVHTIAIYGQSIVGGGGSFSIYDIDDVSLTYPDPPSSSSTSTSTETTPTTTTTTTENPPVVTCAGRTATKVGTDDTEIVTGTPGADVIAALDGDDVVRAGAGNDVVCGGDGNDELKGASGRDRLLGETGRDKLNGGGGAGDRCDGGPSRDKATQSCEKAKHL
jgi:hypothetical protein